MKISPKILFIVDAIGAFITAFLLFVVLRPFNEYIGMPKYILSYLSLIAILFCAYSITCFFVVNKNWRLFLKIISIGNILYCCLTMGLVIYFFNQLTIFGIAYFLLEIVLILLLVRIELAVLKNLRLKTINDFIRLKMLLL